MSSRVCYLERASLGDLISGARLIGPNSDESWTPPRLPVDAAEARDTHRAAADWIAQRVADTEDESRGPLSIKVLCVDAEGSACQWLDCPSGDAAVVAAALAQRHEGAWDGREPAPGAWEAPTPDDASLVALAEDAPSGGVLTRRRRADAPPPRRVAILSVRDVGVRHLIDALDDRGVTVGTVVTLWHAISRAWDPASDLAPRAQNDARVVATSDAPLCAVAVVDPRGRLVWAWSRGGSLVAGGTIRLATPRVDDADRARLGADWLAWSAQLGDVPSRCIVVGPDGGGSLGALASALADSWPGVFVDAAAVDDPIASTMSRLARAPARAVLARTVDAQRALVPLSRRPGRVHRALWWTVAAAFAVASVALLALGIRLWGAAAENNARARELVEGRAVRVAQTLPPGAGDPMFRLDQALGSLRQQVQASASQAGRAPPILEELVTLSYVLPNHNIRLVDMRFGSSFVWIQFEAPDTRTWEDVINELGEIDGTNCLWRAEPQARGDKQHVTFTGSWRTGRSP